MAVFLKETVLLMVVASVLSLPWRPFENAHAPDDSRGPVREDFSLPLDDGTAVDEPPTDDEVEEVYPGTSTKRVTAVDEPLTDDEVEEVYPGASTKRAQENSVLDDDDETAVDFPIEESRKAFRRKRGAVIITPNKPYRCSKNEAGYVDIAYGIGDVNDFTQRMLKDIFYELKLKTCVRFREKGESEDHSVIFRKGSGACKSDIGCRPNKKEQFVDLWYPGCDNRGTIMHEILHLLGFEHEHQRRDRDQYIKVNHGNIKAGLESQFKLKDQDLISPYNTFDGQSIMEYGELAFSKDGVGKTMEARDGHKLGQAAHMDAKDVMKINQLYNCPEKKHYVELKLTEKTGDGYGDGTNADVYIKLKGDKGSTNFEMITEGGMIADENERGSEEVHQMAFEDVGRISSVVVALVNKAAPPPTCSLKKAKRKRGQEKRFMFSTDGWTLNYVKVEGGGISQTFAGPVDLYPGDCKILNPPKKK